MMVIHLIKGYELGQDVYVHSHSVELSGLDFSMLEPGTALSFELSAP